MKIGYQLFSAFRKCRDADGLKAVIRATAEMGYDGVEFFNYAGIPADEMREFLEECNIEAINSHVQIERWERDADFEIDYAVRLGMKWITIPYIAPDDRNEETYARLCQNIPLWNKKCIDRGIILCYHNHDFEYKPYNGGLLLDRFLGCADEMVMEMDTFWVDYAGFDAVDEMKKRCSKLPMIHVKDYLDKECFPPKFCAIGTGEMKNVPIVQTAIDLGVEWVVVEQDNSPIDELDSAKLSVENLRRMMGD